MENMWLLAKKIKIGIVKKLKRQLLNKQIKFPIQGGGNAIQSKSRRYLISRK